jgi:hypothetical protein
MSTNCPHCTKEVTGWIPEDRLSKMAADKREALTQLDALKGELTTAKATADQVSGLSAELAEARTHASQLTQNHSQQLDVYRHGVTDSEDVADLLAIYQRRAPEGVALGDWLGDAGNLPRSVSALLGTPSAPPAEALTAAPPAEALTAAPVAAAPVTPGLPVPVASANAGAIPTPPARSMPSASDISGMSLEEYKSHRDVLIAGLTP